jgi:ribosomal protein S18 acetylase RimI-like enzyme
MPAAAFARFVHEATSSYANDNVIAGRWSPEDALARARAQLEGLLPLGLATPGHFIYEIQDETTDRTVGSLWFAIVEADDVRSGYVYTVRVQPEFRGRGHAKAALELVERVAVAEGAQSIALHVFGFNTGAQALYRSTGYGVTGLNMRKPLRRDGA